MDGNDGFSDYGLTFFEQFEGQAINAAQLTADNLLAGGWTSATAYENPIITLPLHKDILTGILIFPTQGSQPAGGLQGRQLLNMILQLNEVFGLDATTSPKTQGIRPWNCF